MLVQQATREGSTAEDRDKEYSLGVALMMQSMPSGIRGTSSPLPGHISDLMGVSGTSVRGMRELRNAGSQNHVYALYALAQIHLVKNELEETVYFLNKAAELGLPKAMHDLGWLLDNGKGVAAQEPLNAIMWLEKAAGWGISKAAEHLAHMHRLGRGVSVTRSVKTCLSWMRKSADLGSLYARMYLAEEMYRGGAKAIRIGSFDFLTDEGKRLKDAAIRVLPVVAPAHTCVKQDVLLHVICWLYMADVPTIGQVLMSMQEKLYGNTVLHCGNEGCEFRGPRDDFILCKKCRYTRYCSKTCMRLGRSTCGHRHTCGHWEQYYTLSTGDPLQWNGKMLMHSTFQVSELHEQMAAAEGHEVHEVHEVIQALAPLVAGARPMPRSHPPTGRWRAQDQNPERLFSSNSLAQVAEANTAGDMYAMFTTGSALAFDSRGRHDNTTLGKQILSLAADQGHVHAMCALTMIYTKSGELDLAMEWMKLAAENGEPNAMAGYASYLDQGLIRAPDYPEAAKWYRRAAESGDGKRVRQKAAAALSGMYEVGRGVPRDRCRMFMWIRREAQLGGSRACFRLARSMYRNDKWARKEGRVEHVTSFPNVTHTLNSVSRDRHTHHDVPLQVLAEVVYWLQKGDVMEVRCHVAEENVSSLHKFRMEALIGETFCFNEACSFQGHMVDFKFCSKCMRAQYCSSACQRADWTTGGHKHTCGKP